MPGRPARHCACGVAVTDEAEPGPIAEFAAIPAQAKPGPRRRHEKHAMVTVGNYALTKKGVSRYDWADPYRIAVDLSWPQFMAGLVGVYVGVIALFAVAFMLSPGAVANARAWSFGDHFFFSLETLATVGYGFMYPATLYGHCVAATEILTGLAFTAILTGLIFVRFSKPRSKFLFADNPVVTTHNGAPTLMLRVGNGRATVLADARVKISVLISETSKEGTSFRRTHELALARNSIPVFPLTWTVMHEIDAQSPLRGMTEDIFRKADTRLFVSFEARDPTLALVVHDLRSYGPGDVLFATHYDDVISVDENGYSCADMTRISAVLPD